jgi:hypothetical protein
MKMEGLNEPGRKTVSESYKGCSRVNNQKKWGVLPLQADAPIEP